LKKHRSLPSGDDKVRAVRRMFDAIAPRYDLVNRVMTFGMDVRWRRKAVASLGIRKDAVVLDVACGTGDFCREAQRAGGRAVGLDMSMGMLAAASTSAPLVQGDALRTPFRAGLFDAITCGFALRNVADIKELFVEFARVLRPGGRIAVLEVSEPEARVPRAVHHLYFTKVVPFIGGLLSSRDAYSYLPASTAYLPTRSAIIELVQAAGFPDATSRPVGFGAAQIISGRKA
jgi:demethylmenaquinone methyltransferase / 2-methoxy-6-polyprenyl-1,4-benzoquinol methylase